MDVLDDLKDFTPEEKESKLAKVMVFLIAIFMLIIFLVYVFTNFVDLHSIIVSEEVKSNQLDFSFDNKLIFLDNSLDKLKEVYFSNQKTEFKACLTGNKVNNIYYIDDLYIPKTYSQSFNQVVAEHCDSLVSLHSHPYKRCIPSQQDFRNFQQAKQINPEALMIIMCTPDRFSVYE